MGYVETTENLIQHLEATMDKTNPKNVKVIEGLKDELKRVKEAREAASKGHIYIDNFEGTGEELMKYIKAHQKS